MDYSVLLATSSIPVESFILQKPQIVIELGILH